tara:strand:- start:1166 stop:1444 length:279 start_codon:yes stop_codon:yes gene_type:complete
MTEALVGVSFVLVCFVEKLVRAGRGGGGLPRCLVCVGQLELDSVDAVDAVDEEDQDEDEGDLHPVLEFCYYRTLAARGLLACAQFERGATHT